ncbi:MAG: HAD family phosphatase [Negativicutes bacterium]|jgi:HAD superfamily hydrolase (TIGR01509 family)
MKTKFKGMIFDFNGVLLWDSHLHELVWSEYAEQERGTPLSAQEIEQHLHGRVNKYVLEYIQSRELSVGEALALGEEKERLYREKCLNWDGFVLSPGAREFLDYLKANNIPRTIATASEIVNLRFFFEHLNLANWFDFEQVVYDDGSFPGKPAPDIYLRAVQKIGLLPAECIVVEDAVSGIAAANAAGIGYIIGLCPVEVRQKYEQLPGVKVTVTSFEQFDRKLLVNRT